MRKILVIFSLVILTTILFVKENRKNRHPGPIPEGCLSCHAEVRDPDPSHPVSAFACHSCHLGNPHSLDKKRAHFAMVRNPGDLRVADQTCGKEGCHPDIVARVKKGVMATNSGILKTLQYKFLGAQGKTTGIRRVGVSDLMGDTPPRNLGIDHYRKMCGGCHLWKEKGVGRGEVARRGGGCSDCHVLEEDDKRSEKRDRSYHPRMTTRIPSENCVKCHNRSARIGLSYFGRFESAGYGTPYEGRGLSRRRLSGGRFFLELEPDIHFSKVGMECIDCHTATGVMGDGIEYDSMKPQVDITCEACHIPRFSRVSGEDELARRLAFLNRKVPDVEGKLIGQTRKGTPLYNLQRVEDRLFFFRKMDGRPVEMDIPFSKRPDHYLPGHERLSCQACHSAWMPQCYGCHLTYRKSRRQKDWLTGNERPGKWKESRSYLRFSRPALGINEDSRVSPISPCQVFASLFDESDRYRKDKSFKVLTVSAFDPHTTAKRSRECIECHGDPKTLGLGEGAFLRRGGKWLLRPTYDSISSGLGISFALDGFTSLNRAAPDTGTVVAPRAFNQAEIERILSVNACLGCHDRCEDKIYRDFPGSRRRFETDTGLPCRK